VFNSIPATFTDLVIVGTARYNTTGDDAGLQFNSDTNNNYSWQQLAVGGTAPVANNVSVTNYARVINNMDNDRDCGFEINIINYANTSFMKPVISRWGSRQGGNMYWGSFGGSWSSTSAINSITIMKPNGGNWASDSVFTLIGITKE
jgi:hypothetical protein